MKKYAFSFLLFVMSIALVHAEQLYVNPKTGNDGNSGTKSQPLKTIMEASKRVNLNKKLEATTIFLSEGIHLLTQTVVFNNDKYTQTNRLVIRADIMPDDSDWTPQKCRL
nr:DUF1565 domain-containing protein [Elizabethkingia bruuniana]